jgi:CO/xanthine dehydrogenase Mo-binding subunit
VLKEAVAFSATNVTSLDWESYPVLRFGEHPEVTPVVVRRNDPPIGAGEEVLPAVGAAVANAFFDATGTRLTEYPMTPERVLAVLRG